MRDLSDTQARVIRELLVNRPGSDRLKWAAAGVPRSTFQLVRKHAFAAGWVIRRYIPDPASIGVDRVRVEVGHPFAERRAELLSRLARRDGVVVLWDSPGIILAVSFEHTQKREGGPTDPESGWSRRWVIESSLSSSEVLAYFDYEGAWSRWSLGEAPRAYPRGLPWPQKGSSSRTTRFRTEDLAELVRRPISVAEDENGGPWPLAGNLPRRLQGLVNHGKAIPWTIPDLAKIPGLPERELASILLTSGRWAADCVGKQLFQELVSRSRATPFLYAYDANRVIMGLLAPAPATLTEGRTPIAEVLGQSLREIEVIREPITPISPVVNHRYDRLVGQEPR
jgi:hypothetical protein